MKTKSNSVIFCIYLK